MGKNAKCAKKTRKFKPCILGVAGMICFKFGMYVDSPTWGFSAANFVEFI